MYFFSPLLPTDEDASHCVAMKIRHTFVEIKSLNIFEFGSNETNKIFKLEIVTNEE